MTMPQTSKPPTAPTPPDSQTAPERWLERGLFASRWLLAPIYIGLIVALLGLLAVFVQELIHEVPKVVQAARPDEAVVMVLSLIDLSLAGNLILMVTYSGYEIFVSRLDTGGDHNRPEWLGKVDFSGLKLKLIASIVAISAVALLRSFMALAEPGAQPDAARLGWMIGLQMTFVVSGVLMAAMDWLADRSSH
jgi:uncharacterized protein (TIGR00645 family)